MKLILLTLMAINLVAGTITCTRLFGINGNQVTSSTSFATTVTYDETSAALHTPTGILKFERVPHLPEVHSYKGILHPTTMMWTDDGFSTLRLNPTTALGDCNDNH